MSKPQFVYVTYIASTPEKVWAALTEPEFTRQCWFGAHHDTDLGDDALLSDEALEEMAAEVAAEKAEREGETA